MTQRQTVDSAVFSTEVAVQGRRIVLTAIPRTPVDLLRCTDPQHGARKSPFERSPVGWRWTQQPQSSTVNASPGWWGDGGSWGFFFCFLFFCNDAQENPVLAVLKTGSFISNKLQRRSRPHWYHEQLSKHSILVGLSPLLSCGNDKITFTSGSCFTFSWIQLCVFFY